MDSLPKHTPPTGTDTGTRPDKPNRAAVISVLLGLACGAQAIILLISLYTGDVFRSAPLRLMCLSEPVMAAGAIICAGIVFYPLLTESFIPDIKVARRAGSATWLALTGLVVSVIATVFLAFLFVIAMGME